MPDIAVESVNFRRAWNYVVNKENDLLADYLAEKIDCLISGGAQVVSLTAVTMHMVYDELERRIPHPLVSIPKVVSEEVVSAGITRVGLLGTVFTMEEEFMKKDLLSENISVFVPKTEERQLIGKRIFEELEQGIVKESTLAELVTIINRMKADDGIEGIILGCTELPLILNSGNCPVKCLDAVDIHMRKLVSLAMES